MGQKVFCRGLSLALLAAGLTSASCKSRSAKIGLETDNTTVGPVSGESVTDGGAEDFFNEDIEDKTGSSIPDPFRGYNRIMFTFNDKVYEYALRPVSRGYTNAMPDRVERGIENAFHNIAFPKRLAGNLLQAKWDGAARETGKFILNSTVGIAGLLKPSDDFDGLQVADDEDLGQAFGSWGIGHGPYLVLPLLGPYSTRDAVGRAGDAFANPLSYVEDTGLTAGARALDFLNDSPKLMENYDTLKEGSIDPYISAKDAYVQFRNRKLAK